MWEHFLWMRSGLLQDKIAHAHGHILVSGAVCVIQRSDPASRSPLVFWCWSIALSEFSPWCILVLVGVYSRRSGSVWDYLMSINFDLYIPMWLWQCDYGSMWIRSRFDLLISQRIACVFYPLYGVHVKLALIRSILQRCIDSSIDVDLLLSPAIDLVC